MIGRERVVMSKCVLIGCRISTRLRPEACCLKTKWTDKSRMRVYNENEFSSALHEALSYFKLISLRAEQKGCPRRIICLREDVLAVLQANLD